LNLDVNFILKNIDKCKTKIHLMLKLLRSYLSLNYLQL